MIVGLCGFKGCGKSTLARYLEGVHGFRRASFAGPMKDLLATLGWSRAGLWGSSDQRERPDFMGIPSRRALTTLGDWGRELHPDIWVALALAGVRPGERILFEDTRFPNEGRRVMRAGGTVLYLDAPEVEPGFWARYAPEWLGGAHKSEKAVFLTRELPGVRKIHRGAIDATRSAARRALGL